MKPLTFECAPAVVAVTVAVTVQVPPPATPPFTVKPLPVVAEVVVSARSVLDVMLSTVYFVPLISTILPAFNSFWKLVPVPVTFALPAVTCTVPVKLPPVKVIVDPAVVTGLPQVVVGTVARVKPAGRVSAK